MLRNDKEKSKMDKTAVKIVTYFNGIEEFIIGMLFFSLPFGWTLSIVPLVLFFVTLLINVFINPQKPSREKLLYFLPLILIFLWGAISLFYSEDKKEGMEILTTQITLLVAPLAFLFNHITASAVRKGFFMFLGGCVASVLTLYGIAFFKSSALVGDSFVFSPFFSAFASQMLDSDTVGNHFLGTSFSHLVHPSYLALMLGMAMFIVLRNVKNSSTHLKPHGLWLVFFALFGITITSLAMNGTLVLSLLIIILVLGILSIRKADYSKHSRLIYSILFVSLAFVLISPQTKHLAEEGFAAESLVQRAKVTSAAWQVISEHWLSGVGIGGEKAALPDAYELMGEEQLAERQVNSHNQFLTSWQQGGIVALLLIFWSFLTVCRRARKTQTMLLHLFNAMLFVSFLFESMLLRYWGVVTYTIFYGILYFYSEQEIDERVELKATSKN